MKGIIEEQEELQGWDNNITNRSLNDKSNDTGHLTNIIKDKPVNTVYNKEVQNDLSWVENLRYVREISAEEKIPVYYEDGFWESYSLPFDWNDGKMFQSMD